jgi:hypothetical protein
MSPLTRGLIAGAAMVAVSLVLTFLLAANLEKRATQIGEEYLPPSRPFEP